MNHPLRPDRPAAQSPMLSRRHFLEHMASVSALAIPALSLTHSLRVHADQLRRNRKAAILLWMGGGPATIDLWDLKPGQPTGGPFRAISTSGDVQICEHLPLMARQMHNLAIVRSMSTQEADHGRGRYYMHTGYVPNPTVLHPSYGSVVAQQLAPAREDLQLPPFVSIGGSSIGPGFLGVAWAPFVVDANGEIRHLRTSVDTERLEQRMQALRRLETGFTREGRGPAADDHSRVLDKTFGLMTSEQLTAFQVRREPVEAQDRYGRHAFGRGCLMARRLVEAGVPFVEVDLGGWDNHDNIFPTLQNDRLPVLDQGMSALLEDLDQRGLLADTAVIWMGEFGRTPRINGNAGRDHWARAWSVLLGGAGLRGGIAIGQTNSDGTQIETQAYSSQDIMATVCHALGISLETTFTSRNGRPMKIANGGKVVGELFG